MENLVQVILYSWMFTKEALANVEKITEDASLLLNILPVSEKEDVLNILKKDKKYVSGGVTAVSRERRELNLNPTISTSLHLLIKVCHFF